MQPMEALWIRGSYPYKLTAEDHLVIKKWKWRAGAVYGAVLLVLVLIVASGPYTKTELRRAAAISPSPLLRWRIAVLPPEWANDDPDPR